MADVFAVLSHDHDEVQQMLAELESGPTKATGATEPQLAERKKLTTRLIIEESKHEAVEEEYFWPIVRKILPDGDQLADEATNQEQEGKVVLDKLDKLDASDSEFEELLAKFIAAGRDHIAYEEMRVWPGLRGVLSAADANELGDKLMKGKDIAPTRPHPNTPPRPGILKAVGPAAAVADRLRDAVTGRGRD
ncbi:MAG TPA: hemerythrin domain-containing protein [Streptosporangiaceae bacterium]|jgi:hemerythrin-like domain-containing protein|nr:hemerythrin domain-containing protein [Streptosporangiaceae bacterium]